ncbi:MAG: CDP-alcohol phosphatidyltransferase family protein [Thermoprotei archaeon]|nr:MAG: CDP-alcohol phosphatidyltransferase family protein [Thermoprotei archaeon]
MVILLLTKLRKRISPASERLGKALGRAGISPDLLTALGICVAIAVPVAAYFLGWVAALLLMIAASVLDLLDGAVARATGRTSRRGAFLDSVGDRVSDGAFIIALYVLGLPGVPALTLILTSFLISYMRAKGESLSLRMEGVGIMERGDRIIFVAALMIILGLGYLDIGTYLSYLMILLNIVTIIHRGYYIIRGG